MQAFETETSALFPMPTNHDPHQFVVRLLYGGGLRRSEAWGWMIILREHSNIDCH
jgi:hypothetical protein